MINGYCMGPRQSGRTHRSLEYAMRVAASGRGDVVYVCSNKQMVAYRLNLAENVLRENAPRLIGKIGWTDRSIKMLRRMVSNPKTHDVLGRVLIRSVSDSERSRGARFKAIINDHHLVEMHACASVPGFDHHMHQWSYCEAPKHAERNP